ncbi:MAG: Hsp70 family protein [Gammaproteobacteria bacterium]|nr:Hsp70 family protein [Gammaproteobacteria bacterium]
MLLGIDFGTTRTLVAAVDRGNYPVVSFTDTAGDACAHVPSLAALGPRGLVYGFDALAAAADGAPVLRSFKRLLGRPDVLPDTPIGLGGREYPVLDVVTGFLAALATALREHSNLPIKRGDRKLEAVVAVPAHAFAAQRFLTLEAFKAAGFEVVALLNEPSAAGLEYTHRQPATLSSRRSRVVVYDLGGGTFDASLVEVADRRHDVLATAGLNRLGGDDFDALLLELGLAALRIPAEEVAGVDRAAALLACRDAKERLTPQSRRISLDLGPLLGETIVAVDAFYAAATPLVERTLEAMAPVLARLDDGAEEAPDGLAEIAGLYLVGGGSGLPLVPRILRERFGRRVHRSPYPAASTAIGLAIAADPDSGMTLSDRYGRGFGVFRELDDGRRVSFDPIVLPDTPLPASGQHTVARRYRPAHNIGHFRFAECSSIDPALGEPRGDLQPLGELVFPFDRTLRGRDLRTTPVARAGGAVEIEECYLLGADGLVEVRIRDVEDDFQMRLRLDHAAR